MTPEEHDRLDIKLRNISDILAETAASHADFEKGLQKLREDHEKTEAALRRAIRLGVREARAERERRRAGDQELKEMTRELRAAQLLTEEKLQRYLDSRTHHNGDR